MSTTKRFSQIARVLIKILSMWIWSFKGGGWRKFTSKFSETDVYAVVTKKIVSIAEVAADFKGLK